MPNEREWRWDLIVQLAPGEPERVLAAALDIQTVVACVEALLGPEIDGPLQVIIRKNLLLTPAH